MPRGGSWPAPETRLARAAGRSPLTDRLRLSLGLGSRRRRGRNDIAVFDIAHSLIVTLEQTKEIERRAGRAVAEDRGDDKAFGVDAPGRKPRRRFASIAPRPCWPRLANAVPSISARNTSCPVASSLTSRGNSQAFLNVRWARRGDNRELLPAQLRHDIAHAMK
jgi:hypothetical protein